MPGWLLVVSSIAIAAGIGGVTNYIAIKMLFHPRRPWKLGRVTLPLTPGIIPKRKEEISRSLGRVVSEYLVTSAGLQSVLRATRIQDKLEQKLHSLLHTYGQQSFGAIAEQLMGQARLSDWMQKSEDMSRELVRSWVRLIWEEKGWKNKTIGEWTRRMPLRAQLPDRLADLLLEAAREEMSTVRGQRLIQDMIARFLEQGGWLGILAELVTDTDKLAVRVQRMVTELLQSPEARRRLSHFISVQLEKAEAESLEAWVERISGEEALPWLEREVASLVRPERWPQHVAAWSLAGLWPNYEHELTKRVPNISSWLLELAASKVESLVTAIDLPALVENEVRRFPVQRLEELILQISGRELRAITWFGAGIGGLIGIVQCILFL